MDTSVDSIGSCSLDVDAASDVSDTSGSLNFPTPISIKDVTREFTANIKERCAIRNTTVLVTENSSNNVKVMLSQPTTTSDRMQSAGGPASTDDANYDKKPSYLNLACCVNGYSNLTTYDSKIRQDINKSREVSPIRPSSNSIQYCKVNNALAPPVLHTMTSPTSHHGNAAAASGLWQETNNNRESECANGATPNQPEDRSRQSSFIQQRVERLYGPGALAQGFYSPKKSLRTVVQHESKKEEKSELMKKFQELSPGKDYSEFKKKVEPSPVKVGHYQSSATANGGTKDSQDNETVVDLPCLRHLSQEFRAQLTVVSPKKHYSPPPMADPKSANHTSAGQKEPSPQKSNSSMDEVDQSSAAFIAGVHKATALNGNEMTELEKASSIKSEAPEMDGQYFLNLLKSEQARLLTLAAEAEAHMAALKNNPDSDEDVLGFLRSASGKARLLVSQKMKQFEGLCHKNLNCSPDDPFPTTTDDLQGFWDMVNLQVQSVDSVFAEIEALKQNNWKKPETKIPITPGAKTANVKAKATTGTNGSKSPAKTPTASPAVKSAAALKREAQRRQLLEIKRRNRMAMNNSDDVPHAEHTPLEVKIGERPAADPLNAKASV